MRCLILGALAVIACGKPRAPAPDDAPRATTRAPVRAPARDAESAGYPDLATALTAIVPADARVLGVGELHSRVDRAQVRSALAAFTAALPAFGAQVSDLVIETWLVDPTCGKAAVEATAQVEATVKRPASTKTEIALLAEAAKALAIQPHAMTVSCADYQRLAPGGEIDPIAMLTLTTRELARIMASAVAHRATQPAARPWIVVYGGALHNDRFPAPGVAEWSYAARADEVTRDRFVEIDLIVPELAAADEASRAQPWFALVAAANERVQVWRRDARSFVLILPATR